MPQTWAVPLTLLLLGIIGTLVGMLWHTKHKQDDEREKNWKEWRDRSEKSAAEWHREYTSRLLSIDMKLATIDLLDSALRRAIDDINSLGKWKHEKGIPYVAAMDVLKEGVDDIKDRVGRLERQVNGKA